MTFAQKIEALKQKVNARIKPDSSAEEIEALNNFNAELDALVVEHDGVLTENAKFKDSIVRLVTTQGDGNNPQDDSDGSKPMSIDEVVAQVSKGGK